MTAWYTISPSPWSIIMYAFWAWWASKKIPKDKYVRFHRLAAWVDAVWIAGVVVLVGDILFVMAVWIRWLPTYSGELFVLVNSLIRNVSLLIVSLIMSWDMWKLKWARWGLEVYLLWCVNILFLLLWFGLSPGLEWTHWVYALENGFASWPYAWFISFVIGRIITTMIYVRTWNVEQDR